MSLLQKYIFTFDFKTLQTLLLGKEKVKNVSELKWRKLLVVSNHETIVKSHAGEVMEAYSVIVMNDTH